MSNPAKQIVLGAARLVGTTMVCERLPRTRDKSAASGAAVPSDARQLSGNEASALPPSDATPTRDTPPLAPRQCFAKSNCKIRLCQHHNLSRRCDLEIAFATSMTTIILKSSNRAN
jgi:hypothetical protein